MARVKRTVYYCDGCGDRLLLSEPPLVVTIKVLDVWVDYHLHRYQDCTLPTEATFVAVDAVRKGIQ